MKKNLIKMISMFAFVGGSSVGFAETEYVAADNSPISKLCVSAAVDDKVRFNLNMNKSRLTDRYIRTNIACNGKSIAQFARDAGNFGNYYLLEVNPEAQINIYKTSDQREPSQDKVILVAGR